MRFGRIALADARGAVLAHSLNAGGKRLAKARRLTEADIDLLRAAGIDSVIAVHHAPDDVGEDEAAARLAAAFVTSGVTARPAATGRVNLHATADGVFTVDRGLIDAVNAVDASITVATLTEHAVVSAGAMVATVKIIPFAVSSSALQQAVASAATRLGFAVHPFRARRIALVQTTLPALKASVLDKTARVTAARLERSGSRIASEIRVPHDTEALAAAIGAIGGDADMILIFGASAVCDPRDVIPAAIALAGGRVERVGMPVDPGNLLVLGSLGDAPVIGAPGCARSPKENGFDWVLDRLMADLAVSARDIAGMGVGGLLTEIGTRPQPREGRARGPVEAIVLAAGRSSRMGGPNKLLALFEGAPLVRTVAERALASGARATTVVVGHQGDAVEEALAGLDLRLVDNPAYGEGLATSLKAGISALPADVAGALVLLGDMPRISTADIDALIAAFRDAGGKAVVRATDQGRRGNPVILPRSLFALVDGLDGDSGARALIDESQIRTVDVEIGAGAFVDVDTPEALAAAGGTVAG